MRPLTVSSSSEVDQALAAGAVVAFGVSGGKDSSAAVAATYTYLDSIGHPRDRRVLIHADLGDIEWAQSGTICSQLATVFGSELMTVRSNVGGMCDHWEKRWERMASGFRDLSRLGVTMPWSSASSRFCTSHAKTEVIFAALRRRFRGQTIISVSGIRREESRSRALKPVWKSNPELFSKRDGTSGLDWNPIIDFTVEDVWAAHAQHKLPIHEAYTIFHSERVSCAFCILQSIGDRQASFANPVHRQVWRRLVELELESGFAFQSKRWLADLGLPSEGQEFATRVAAAKQLAAARQAADALIPASLRYSKGWPHRVPTFEEAGIIAAMRRTICELYGWESAYLTGETVRTRYGELLARNGDQEQMEFAA